MDHLARELAHQAPQPVLTRHSTASPPAKDQELIKSYKGLLLPGLQVSLRDQKTEVPLCKSSILGHPLATERSKFP